MDKRKLHEFSWIENQFIALYYPFTFRLLDTPLDEGWFKRCDLKYMILFCYCTELKAIIHESVNLKRVICWKLQIASCQSASRGFLNLACLLFCIIFFLYWWEQKTTLCSARRKTIGERQYYSRIRCG